MNKGYKFRIYPNGEQKIMFAKTFGCVRFVYNRMLADKFAKKKSVTPAKYKEEFEWLNAKHFGKPHFKSKKNRQSYSTNNQKGTVRIEGGK